MWMLIISDLRGQNLEFFLGLVRLQRTKKLRVLLAGYHYNNFELNIKLFALRPIIRQMWKLLRKQESIT